MAQEGFEVARAYVLVEPDTSGFGAKLQADLERYDYVLKVDVEPDAAGFREKLAADLAGLPPVEVPVEANVADFAARLEAALAASRTVVGGGIDIPVRFDEVVGNIRDMTADLMMQTQLLRQMEDELAGIQHNVMDTSADLHMQTGILSEIRDLLAENAALAGSFSSRIGDATASTVVAGTAARTAAGGFAFWGLTIGGWLTAIHLGMVTLGAQVAADAIGITAFGIAASRAIGPAVSAVGNLTTQYSGLDNYQKAAALSLRSFLDGIHQADEAGIFGVFYQGLNLVQQVMTHTPAIVTQATKAFSDFGGMLAADFGSPAWASVFGHGASLIRKDLDALFNLINHGINLIPALFHNFNSLGLGVMHVASGFLGAVRAVAEFNPGLTRAAALATAAYGAYRIFWAGLGAGPGILQRLAVGARGAAISTAAFGMNLQAEGAAAAFAAAGTTSVVLTFGAAAAAAGYLIFHYGNLKTSTDNLITTLTNQDHALGNNAAGYRQLASQLSYYQDHITKATGAVHGIYGAITTVSNAQQTLSRTQNAATQSAQNITRNATTLGNVLGITRGQVIQLANKTGVDLTHSMQVGSASFISAAAKIKGLDQAITLSHSPLSQYQVDVNQSRSATNSLTQQVQALQAGFAAFVAPTLNAAQGAITLRNDIASATTALRASNDVIGLHTQAQRTAGSAIIQAANDALRQSANIKQLTGSTSAAAGPLQTMISFMQRMHIQGAMAAEILAKLQAAINALHSKTVTISVNTVLSGLAGGGPGGVAVGGKFGGRYGAEGAVIPGYAPGQDTVTAKVSPGEAIMVPEWVQAVGPENVMAINRLFSSGRRSQPGSYQGGGIEMSGQFRFPQDIFNINVRADTNVGSVLAAAATSGGGFQMNKAQQQVASQAAQAMRQYASSITSNLASSYSSLSAIASGAPTNAAGQPVAVTGQFIRTQLAAKLATLKKFFHAIKLLRNRGVDRSLIAQVVTLGPDQGLQYADAILSGGGALIRELNSEETQIGKYETMLGRRAAEIHYGTPIAQGFAMALKSHEVEAELKKFGRKVAIEIARELGVPLGDVPGLVPHHRPDHHGHQGRNAAVTINFHGTQRPTHEEMAAIKREMGLALAGSW